MDSNVLIVLLVLLAVGALAVFFLWQRKRSAELRKKFGPEYGRTVQQIGDQRKAEKELASRQHRVEAFKLHDLTPEKHQMFLARWQSAQALFVDEPSRAVQEGDALVKEAMQARGYPVGDFEQRAADISVNYPQVVQNYRSADLIAKSNSRGEANTEDLRRAMVYYRDLFAELLEDPKQKRERRQYEEAVR